MNKKFASPQKTCPTSLRPAWWTVEPVCTFLFVFLVLETVFIQMPLRIVAFSLAPQIFKPTIRWSLAKALLISSLKHLFHYRSSLGKTTGWVDKSKLPRFSGGQRARAIWINPINGAEKLSGRIRQLYIAGGCTVAHFPAYWVGELSFGRAKLHEKVLLYFHGGGYRALRCATQGIQMISFRRKKAGKSHTIRLNMNGLALLITPYNPR
ncbi:uncharacterized protein FA14DRAFT_158981 [Meira miltonrushii]|uniref:Alpha/beta hydrolase fold-3 domain-containing protein n=1 Tax=Meira miltonrushii TaxID=1280837 RepID=A0A316VFU3_9BASI|nr:uncharacterized protein FA14DRAFT_158981 [Meira miltonrushii]PWN36452.1 hypothetical protein FA14DRAFT_158981 [Meira miltonrushii]